MRAVGFTGTRCGMTDKQKEAVREFLVNLGDAASFHHGDCIGADAEANLIAYELGIPRVIHPPIENSKRAFCDKYTVMHPRLHYLDRNRAIVDECDVLIAAPDSEKEKPRSGTWYTIRYARKIRRHVCIVTPDGYYIETPE